MKYIIILIYILFISGLFIIVKPYIKQYYLCRKIENKVKINSRSRMGKKFKINPDPLSRHIALILKTVAGRDDSKPLVYFYLISVSMSVFGMIIALKLLPLSVGLIISVSLLILPYMCLRGKLQVIRVSASLEGDILISELLNNYKISFYNMQEAIEKTGLEIEEAPYSKKLLLNLARGLARTGSNEEVKELIEVFKYSLNTSWGNILGTNIYFAATSGIRVTEALADLSESIAKARKVLEYTRRENNEAMLMIKYLAPVCYILTLLGAIKYFNFTLSKFFAYQFGTTTGITWFSIICITYIVGIFAAIFFSKRKMEL